MAISHTHPEWLLARIKAISEANATINREIASDPEQDRRDQLDLYKRLLQNGHIHQELSPDNLIREQIPIHLWMDLERSQIDPTQTIKRLDFEQLTRWNTWFTIYPDKVVGTEWITTSREFPISIKGKAEHVQSYFRNVLPSTPTHSDIMKRFRQRALALKAKLTTEMKDSGLSGASPSRSFSLNGPNFLQSLGSLGKLQTESLGKKQEAVRSAIARSKKEKQYEDGDVLSFKDVVDGYNKDISREEIQAWVWFKRSLDIPMTGWEDYFLSTSGEVYNSVYATGDAVILDESWNPIRTATRGANLGKHLSSYQIAGEDYWTFRNEEGIRIVKARNTRLKKFDRALASDSELISLVQAGALFYLNGELLPYAIYAYGNMYDRELQLRKDQEAIEKKYGIEAFSRHEELIKTAKPKLISIINPDPSERPRVLAISEFAKQFHIKGFREEYNVEFTEAQSLRAAFEAYLKTLDQAEFKASSAHEIFEYYVEGKRVSGASSSDERRTIKANARNEGEEHFQTFLHEALEFEDQQKFDIHWNRLYNGQSALAYRKIPVGFSASAKFKQFNLEIRPAQREGIAFMNAVGSGIVAYDVGVGKTITAIVTIADALQSGKVKRPLIVVPNPTYKKWIQEIIGFKDKSGTFVPGVLSHTGVTINEWYNLGKKYQSRIDFEESVPEGSITIVTYEGFKKIGYSTAVIGEMFDELTNILTQAKVSDLSERDKEINYQKYREMIGVGLKDTIADIDTLGFDMLAIDEAHRCKNIFPSVKKDDDGNKRFGVQGAVSETGVKAFFLCNYIQRRYGRNVMLLTATPFTNSPLEIYSMLSLVAYESMKSMGILNIKVFFETFVQETTEYVVNLKEEIVPKDIVKRYNNRLVLQKLIYNHINYKTGEEAGITRPCKINLPRVNVLKEGRMVRLHPNEQTLTYLGMNDAQRQNQNGITASVKMATRGQLSLALIFKALNWSLDNALSPFLMPGAIQPDDAVDFVENSPKVKYTMECIRSVRDYHLGRKEDVSGQVIYINRGKRFFPLMKQYLEEEIGYKTGIKWGRVRVDEVEVISGGMSATRKENVKEAFLDGAVKVIIGTASIREGIDLQKRSTVLYNLYPDWNPTDIRQLEGRIWRQGNRHGFVRVVMPLVQDSMDVFVFQKLEEKTSRINDIWYRGDRGNVLDLEALDPEEIKFALITDIKVIASMKLKVEKAEAERNVTRLQNQIEVLGEFATDLQRYTTSRATILKWIQEGYENAKGKEWLTKPDTKEGIAALESWRREKIEKDRTVFKHMQKVLDAVPITDKAIIRLLHKMGEVSPTVKASSAYRESWMLKESLAKVKKAEKTILKSKGYTLDSNIPEVIEQFNKDLDAAISQRNRVSSEEYLQVLVQEARAKKSAMAVDGKSISERVVDFAKLNYLMSFRTADVDNHNCIVPGPESERKSNSMFIFRMRAKALRLKLLLEKEMRESA